MERTGKCWRKHHHGGLDAECGPERWIKSRNWCYEHSGGGRETRRTCRIPFHPRGHMSETDQKSNLLQLTGEIVASFVANNAVAAGDLPNLIDEVHLALRGAVGDVAAEPAPEPLNPAVPIRKSITPDHLVCLEDGKTFKSLKRHLRVHYNLSPDEYRQRWGLPRDYPMVASNYAAARSELARRIGLGQQRKAVAAPEPGPAAKTRSTKRKPKPSKADVPASET